MRSWDCCKCSGHWTGRSGAGSARWMFFLKTPPTCSCRQEKADRFGTSSSKERSYTPFSLSCVTSLSTSRSKTGLNHKACSTSPYSWPQAEHDGESTKAMECKLAATFPRPRKNWVMRWLVCTCSNLKHSLTSGKMGKETWMRKNSFLSLCPIPRPVTTPIWLLSRQPSENFHLSACWCHPLMRKTLHPHQDPVLPNYPSRCFTGGAKGPFRGDLDASWLR